MVIELTVGSHLRIIADHVPAQQDSARDKLHATGSIPVRGNHSCSVDGNRGKDSEKDTCKVLNRLITLRRHG